MSPSHPRARWRVTAQFLRWRPSAIFGVAASAVMIGALSLPAQAAESAPGTPAAAAALVTDPASLVNPFIGTTNSADDFPGADAPFGMVQWSPDTSPNRPSGGGYEYSDSAISGFSLTHLSGPGCGAEGDIPVLPTVGTVDTSATDSFSHSNESAEAGYYKVALDNGVTTQLTATTRTGMADFTFPSSSQANLIFKLDGSQNGDSATSFTVISNTEVQGSVNSGNFCGKGNSYTVYFDMQFSQPFATSGTYSAAGLQAGAKSLTVRQDKPAVTPETTSPSVPEKTNHPVYHGALPSNKKAAAPALTGPDGSYLTFNTTSNQTVLAKVGVSYVSAANAKANLAAENSGWNFTSTQNATTTAWNNLLDRVRIAGGTAAQQTVFYTALYHSLLHPNVYLRRQRPVHGVQRQGTDRRLRTLGRLRQLLRLGHLPVPGAADRARRPVRGQRHRPVHGRRLHPNRRAPQVERRQRRDLHHGRGPR